MIATNYILHRRHRTGFLAIAEYWVYLPEPKLPDQTLIMDRVVGNNPYQKGIRSPINAPEGLVLSDVRLGIGLVLRSKNPRLFRPDLDLAVEPTADQFDRLASSQAIARLRFVSEVPLTDKRHLQFLLHAADAYAELGGTGIVMDLPGQRMWSREELQVALADSLDVTGFKHHVRLRWVDEADLRLVTSGLSKIGLPEIYSEPASVDQQTLVETLVREYAEACWSTQTLLKAMDLTHLDSRYSIELLSQQEGRAYVKLLRMDA